MSTINSSVTFGATADDDARASKTTLDSATSGLFLNVQITNGRMAGQVDHEIILRWAVSPFSVTAGAAPVALKHTAGIKRLRFYDRNPSAVQIFATDLILNNGGYLYTWFECPALVNDVTVTLELVEI